MKTITISFNSTIRYEQIHEIDDELYEKLKKYDGEDLTELTKEESKRDAYYDVLDLIDYESVIIDDDIEDFEIEEK